MSTVDFVVVVVMVLSTLLAILRGFTREIFTIIAWIGTILVTIYGLPVLKPAVESLFDDKSTADIAAGALLAIGTLVALSLVAWHLGKLVKKSGLGPVDRSLGGLFGAMRGALVLCLAYIVLTTEAFQAPYPDWLTKAKTQPLLAAGSEKLLGVVPPSLKEMLATDKPKDQKDGQKTDDAEKSDTGATVPPEKPLETKSDLAPARTEDKAGYDKGTRDNLDKLVDQAAKPKP